MLKYKEQDIYCDCKRTNKSIKVQYKLIGFKLLINKLLEELYFNKIFEFSFNYGLKTCNKSISNCYTCTYTHHQNC